MADRFHVDFKMFVNRRGVIDRVDRWKLRILSRTGAFGRIVMRRKIRPPLVGKRSRTVTIEGRRFTVPPSGKVIDQATGRIATTRQSELARRQFAIEHKRRTAGQPPRRGPADLLRKFMFFGVDASAEEVRIGPLKFTSQPQLYGARSVPELLETGGGELIAGKIVKYEARPYAAPSFDETLRKMETLIERTPLR